jgi:hypothetical protein
MFNDVKQADGVKTLIWKREVKRRTHMKIDAVLGRLGAAIDEIDSYISRHTLRPCKRG